MQNNTDEEKFYPDYFFNTNYYKIIQIVNKYQTICSTYLEDRKKNNQEYYC